MAALQFIDVHAHLYDSKFDADIDDVIVRAQEVGVKKAIVVSENVQNCSAILKLADRFPEFCLIGFGVHPVQGNEEGSVRSAQQQDVDALLSLIHEHQERLVCIGEVGLDFTPRYCSTEDSKTSQRNVLQQMGGELRIGLQPRASRASRKSDV